MAEAVRKNKALLGNNDHVIVTREFIYDFNIDGGAVGSISLKGGVTGAASTLPAGAIITGVRTRCLTAATSGGAATIALGITGTTDAFEAATAYTDNSYDTVGTLDFKNPSAPVLITSADTSIVATIATAALTAGRFKVYVDVMLP